MAQVGYRPNAIAASLRTNRSSIVGVMIPDLTNPLFAAIVRGIEDALGAAGYTVILGNSDNEPGRERTMLQKMRERREFMFHRGHDIQRMRVRLAGSRGGGWRRESGR